MMMKTWLGKIESIVIDDEESEVRQEVEGFNLVINARLY
jgi:hypothetical protein